MPRANLLLIGGTGITVGAVLAFRGGSALLLRLVGVVAMIAGAVALAVWFRQSKLIDRD